MAMSSTASVGIPREVKRDERRGGLPPAAAGELPRHGLKVWVERGAGKEAGLADEEFAAAGAVLVDAAAAWSANVVVKVKEPQPEEYRFLREDLVLFTYLHLAGYPAVAQALMAAKVTAIAYETVQMGDGSLPLLSPMSEIAGRLAAQVGASLLEKPHGGPGILIGGCTGVQPARVVVLGAGTVGWSAARIAAGMDAEVFLLDRSSARLRQLEAERRGRMVSLMSSQTTIERLAPTADLLIGAVLTPGGRAPTLVDEQLVQRMNPGSVIVEIPLCLATPFFQQPQAVFV
ncbi:MAG TPA: alanine dehydrogenase [Synechococcus sp. UBA8638]|nr:alanine dehydrogenase [Synechococcus sp. UBA8638]